MGSGARSSALAVAYTIELTTAAATGFLERLLNQTRLDPGCPNYVVPHFHGEPPTVLEKLKWTSHAIVVSALGETVARFRPSRHPGLLPAVYRRRSGKNTGVHNRFDPNAPVKS